MKKVIVLITSLDVGGAETYLSRMLRSRPEIDWKVFTIKDYGRTAEDLSRHGFYVKKLGFSLAGIQNSFLFLKMIFSNHNLKIITFLYHADLVVRLISLCRNVNHIMMIRHSDTSYENNSLITVFTLILLRLMARFRPPKIIFNSFEALENHMKIGIIGRQNHVVHNGVFIDENLVIRPKKRRNSIGILGRIHPIKGQLKFIKSLQNLNQMDFSCIHLAGRHALMENVDLVEAAAHLKHEMILHGEIKNLTEFFDLIDVLIIPSLSESFPNVLLEAYLHGVPVAAFCVGDVNRAIIEESHVAPSGNYEQLNSAISSIMNLNDQDYEELRKRCFNQARTKFDSRKKFEELFQLIERN